VVCYRRGKVSLIDQEADRSYTSLSQTISRSDRSTSMLIVAEIEDEPETRQFNFFNSYDIIEDITADHVAAEFLNGRLSCISDYNTSKKT